MAYKFGLVLEGGGMRGVFTAGVVDALNDYDVRFPYVIGTSAGASNACVYIARQRGRVKFINIDLQAVHPYIGFSSVFHGKGVIDLDFVFSQVPVDYYPFDFETFRTAGCRCVIVSTSAITGEAVYTEEYDDFARFVDANRASCSLPLLCPPWHIDDVPMVDGGVGDSIPFARALADGCERVVVVTTKDASYRKSERKVWLPANIYKEYPKLREALLTRNVRYNRQVDDLNALAADGTAIVVRPTDMHGVSRTTSDVEALEALYAEGLRAGRDLALTMKPLLA